jgi:outer membrane protein assembly factor BamB
LQASSALQRSARLLVLGAGLAACESVGAGAHPEVPLWVHRPSYSMEIVYQRHVVAETRRTGERYERGQPAIDATHRRLFVGSSDRGLYALRAEDGDVLWRFETVGAVQSEPLYDAVDDAVYFGSNDGALYKVRAADGGLLWRFMSNAEVARRPVKVDDVLYFVNANDTVLALNAKTGERLWSQHRSPALGMEIAGHSGVLIDGGAAFVAFSAGTVAAFDAASGVERWEPVDLSLEAEQLLDTIPKYLDVDSTPVAAHIDGSAAIVVGSYEAGVYALERDSGTQIWANNAALTVTDVMLWSEPEHTARDGVRHPARELLLVSTGTTGMWALDVQTGAEVWRRDLPQGGTQRPVPVSGAVLVATTEQGLFLVSPRDGGVIDGLDTGEGFSMPPAAVGERAFILSNDGDLLALSIPSPQFARPARHSWP